MNELIQTIEILSETEVEKLNSYIDTLKFEKSTVFGEGDNKDPRTNPDLRSSTGVTLHEDHELTKKLHLKLNAGLDDYKERVSKIHSSFQYYPVPGGYETNSWREGIQVLDYEKTQEYKFHHDVADEKSRQEFYRTISIILYLTNDFEGGRTLFNHDAFKPKVGSALIFPSNWCYPHAGEPVTSGKKRVAVTWYYVEKQ